MCFLEGSYVSEAVLYSTAKTPLTRNKNFLRFSLTVGIAVNRRLILSLDSTNKKSCTDDRTFSLNAPPVKNSSNELLLDTEFFYLVSFLLQLRLRQLHTEKSYLNDYLS